MFKIIGGRMFKHSRLWAGLAALAAAGPALAEKYIPSTDRAQIIDPAAGWDQLWNLVLFDITVMGVLFAAVIAYFIWKYRKQPGVEGGGAAELSVGAALAWSLIPAFIFLADDLYIAVKGWQLWNVQRTVPADRLEIKLESGMYSWDYTYPNGVQTQNELKVPAGKPVLLRMTSRDTIHTHYAPDFKVKEDSMPGRTTYMWFYPQKPGKHLVVCNEYCGIMHSYMSGQILVLPPAEYNTWYEQEGGKLKQATSPAPAVPPAGAVPVAKTKKPA